MGLIGRWEKNCNHAILNSSNLTNMYFEDEIVNAIPDHSLPVERSASRNFISPAPVQDYALLPAPVAPPPKNDNLRVDNLS